MASALGLDQDAEQADDLYTNSCGGRSSELLIHEQQGGVRFERQHNCLGFAYVEARPYELRYERLVAH